MKEKEILKDKDLEMFGGKLSQEKTQMSYFFFVKPMPFSK